MFEIHAVLYDRCMEWSDLKVFLAIARAGTLGAAARALGQTQPTMGRRLRALEQAVGQALIQRTSDGFVLTAEGAAVLAHAERVEEEAIAFERRLAGQAGTLEGMLRISASDWFGARVLAPILADFIRVHPGIVVELVTDARLFSLARREADLVVRIRPFDEPEVVQRRLTHVPYALYAAAGTPVPGDGAGCALVTMDTAFETMPDVGWLTRMLPQARIAFRSNNREVQARACAAWPGCGRCLRRWWTGWQGKIRGTKHHSVMASPALYAYWGARPSRGRCERPWTATALRASP
jgi:DNA-binding transcriptional LysR family regulator